MGGIFPSIAEQVAGRRRWPYLWPGRLAERVHWEIPAAERQSRLNLAKAILCLEHVLELAFFLCDFYNN
jgi:uncharacterized Fe-S cluster-containing radical SAM superfamily protein